MGDLPGPQGVWRDNAGEGEQRGHHLQRAWGHGCRERDAEAPEAEKPEEKVMLTVHEPVAATFALRYLVNFAKAAPLCGTVELGLGPDAALLVKYMLDVTDNGHMQFYLAPKIDE